MINIAKIKLIKTLRIEHVETGANARREREERRISLRRMAKYLGFSPAYIHDLELGKRNWNMNKIRAYEKVLKDIGMP